MTSLSGSLIGSWRYRFTHVYGQRLHIAEYDRPSDPFVLFIHGSTGSWSEWREALPLLSDDPGDPLPVHVVATSTRGYGQSDRTPQGYDPLEATQDIASSIRSLGHSTALLVCQGSSTWVVWALALRQPDLVAGIIGCGAAHPKVWLNQLESPWSEDFRSSLAPLLHRSWWDSRPRAPRLCRNKFSIQAAEARQQRLIDRIVRESISITGQGFAEALRGEQTAGLMADSLANGALRFALTHMNWWTRLTSVAFRKWSGAMGGSSAGDEHMVLLAGEQGTRTPHALVRLNSTHMRIIPGCGHFPPVEKPQAVVQAIRDHLHWLPEGSQRSSLLALYLPHYLEVALDSGDSRWVGHGLIALQSQ